jgi:hypothetical protein
MIVFVSSYSSKGTSSKGILRYIDIWRHVIDDSILMLHSPVMTHLGDGNAKSYNRKSWYHMNAMQNLI